MVILGNTLRFYEGFTRNDADADRARGAEDGLNGEPESGSKEFGGYQLNVINRTRADLSNFVVEQDQRLSVLETERSERQLRHASYSGQRDNLLRERQDAENQLSEVMGPASKTYQQAADRLKVIEDQLNSIRNAENDRPLRAYMSRKLYALTFLALFCAELPINIPAVSTIFRESLLSSGVIAASLSLVMVYFAHSLGRLMRQPSIFRGGSWLYWVLIVALSLLSVGIVLSIYMLRQHYIGSGVLNLDFRTAQEAGWLFLFVNTAVFCAGILVAIFHHDPNPDYQRLTYVHHDLSRSFGQIEQKYNRALSARREEYDERQRRMNLDFKRIETEIKEKVAAINSLKQNRRTKVDLALAVLGERLAAYQEGNLSTRTGPVPLSFGSDSIELIKQKLRKEFIGSEA